MSTTAGTSEARVISWAMAATAVVICVCICILAVAGMLFGVASLKAHWPS